MLPEFHYIMFQNSITSPESVLLPEFNYWKFVTLHYHDSLILLDSITEILEFCYIMLMELH